MADKKKKKSTSKVSPHPYRIDAATRAKISAIEGLEQGVESLGEGTGKLQKLTGKIGESEVKLKKFNCVKKGGKWTKGKCVIKK